MDQRNRARNTIDDLETTQSPLPDRSQQIFEALHARIAAALKRIIQ